MVKVISTFKRFNSRQWFIIVVSTAMLALLAGYGIVRALSPPVIETHREDLTYAGYTLVAPNSNTNVYLVDNKGKRVHSWDTDNKAGAVTKLLPGGSLLRTYQTGGDTFSMGGIGGGIQIIDWDGNVTWDYTYASDTYQLHHDVSVMPNGHFLALAWVKISEREAIAAGIDPENLDPESKTTWSERVIEIDPETDEVVWQWDAFDHLVQDYDETKANYGSVAGSPHKIDANYYEHATKPDWFHANSVDYNAETDQIIVSARSFNEFWVIDHSTTTAEAASSSGGNAAMGGDLLYRYGNLAALNLGEKTDRTLYFQHDAQWIKSGLSGAGNVLVFSNGDAKSDHNYSLTLELKLPSDGYRYAMNEDGSYEQPEIVWQYGGSSGETSFFSQFMAGAQRLANGNTLISDATHGRAVEVTADGTTAWVYKNPSYSDDQYNPGTPTNSVFRFYKYSADSEELAGLL